MKTIHFRIANNQFRFRLFRFPQIQIIFESLGGRLYIQELLKLPPDLNSPLEFRFLVWTMQPREGGISACLTSHVFHTSLENISMVFLIKVLRLKTRYIRISLRTMKERAYLMWLAKSEVLQGRSRPNEYVGKTVYKRIG